MTPDAITRQFRRLVDEAERGTPADMRAFATACRAAATDLSRATPSTGGRPFPYAAILLRELAARAERNAFAAAGAQPARQRTRPTLVRQDEALT